MARRLAKFIKGGHPMSFQDKSLKCTDCGTGFTFTSGEQEFYATKGYADLNMQLPVSQAGRCILLKGGRRPDNGPVVTT